ncbi:hypothetical protein KMW28_22150 [Flammeovirga yaeyamensis]|uniref:Uncharacterized protein n=1 Tax=Flammeovirga yaeyamensis TaxID=367791 RepID=A0AAX1NC17_9BACT|nr:hypothetical protein [Flammeovirga yaeyamensis]MBB3696940.1 hypothetical protein [Flammeovirga yaeyamensis]NMF33603.1 hypothetical protein [Flammeovirga yaeyamensis]QWG05129.1 hypothetical protein KMW28_22150 [Flammeovirga yaeyamensis]
MKKILLLFSLLFIYASASHAQLVIVVQAVASSIKAPNSLDNVTFYHKSGETTTLPIRKVKKKMEIQDFDSVKVQTVYALERVQKIYGSSTNTSDIPEDALYYAHTKRYRNARMSSLFAASAWSLSLLNPYFLIVAPLPTLQALKRDKGVDKKYVMNGKEWRTFKKEYKVHIKNHKNKSQASVVEADNVPSTSSSEKNYTI